MNDIMKYTEDTERGTAQFGMRRKHSKRRITQAVAIAMVN